MKKFNIRQKIDRFYDWADEHSVLLTFGVYAAACAGAIALGTYIKKQSEARVDAYLEEQEALGNLIIPSDDGKFFLIIDKKDLPDTPDSE